MKKTGLFILLISQHFVSQGQLLSGLTGKPDTSFNVQSEYRKHLKNYPFIHMVSEKISDSIKVEHDVVYGNTGNRNLLMDVFTPGYKSGTEKRTALIFIFGGGWRSGNRTLHYPLVERLAAMGYVCFTPEYRLSTEALYPAAVHDIKAAIRWVRKNAGVYGIDPDRIVIGGHSAGGQLAALMGSTHDDLTLKGNCGNEQQSDKVNAVIDVDGILAFIHPESGEGDDSRKIAAATYWFGYSNTENPSIWEQASPLHHVNKMAAPILFLNSSVARMHAGREDYIKELNKFGIYSKVVTYENAPHSFCFFDPWFDPMLKEMDVFLRHLFPE